MPDIRDAIKITSMVSIAASVTQWGIPAIIGESSATEKNTPKKFTSLELVKAEHGEESDVYKGAYSMHKQGVKTVYTVSLAVAGETPTATEAETALGTLSSYVSAGEIDAAVFAAITNSNLLEKLRDFADEARIIFVATHAEDEILANILAAAASLESVNGFFVAYKSVESDDVACAAMGAIMARKPFNTLTWLEVDVDVDDYFSPSVLESLEDGRVNAIIRYTDDNRLSNGMSLDSTVPFLDTTRTQYYIETLIAKTIAQERMNASQVPYTQKGFEVIRSWIVAPLEELIRVNSIDSYSVKMPNMEEITTEDQANRTITGVHIEIQTIGDIQAFEISLNIKV
jgi:hypothetical protein